MGTSGDGIGMEIIPKKKRSLFSLRRPPQVIELYTRVKREDVGNPPAFFAGHLNYWLRNYAFPGKSNGGGSYPDGMKLSRKDVDLIKLAVGNIFGNFVFMKPGASSKKARKVAKAFTRASKIFWEGKKRNFHLARVVENPETHLPLHNCLLGQLNGWRDDTRQEEEIERIAEYFVIYCQSNRKILKELALEYHRTDKQRDEHLRYLPSADD